MVIGNLTSLNQGSAICYPAPSFDPVSSLEAIEKYKCTSLYGVPTMYTATLAEQQKLKKNVSTLCKGVTAGSLCPKPLAERIYNELNMKGLCNFYGMTELSPVATFVT